MGATSPIRRHRTAPIRRPREVPDALVLLRCSPLWAGGSRKPSNGERDVPEHVGTGSSGWLVTVVVHQVLEFLELNLLL